MPPSVRQQKITPSQSSTPMTIGELLWPSGCCASLSCFLRSSISCHGSSLVFFATSLRASSQSQKIQPLPVLVLTCGSLRAAGKLLTPPAGRLPLCKNIAASGAENSAPKLAPPLLHSQAVRKEKSVSYQAGFIRINFSGNKKKKKKGSVFIPHQSGSIAQK